MFGSNAYMGLTYDKRIIDASIAATEKIWHRLCRFPLSERNTRYTC